MPRRKYRLRPFAPRSLELDWHGDWENIRVFFNGRSLGAIQDKPSLETGSTFILGQNSYLDVRLQKGFFRERLALFWNGIPLPGTFSDPRSKLQTTSIILVSAALMMLLLAALGFLFKDIFPALPIAPEILTAASLIPATGAYFLHTFRRKAASLLLAALFCEMLVYLISVLLHEATLTFTGISARLLAAFLMARGLCLIEDIYDMRRKHPPVPPLVNN